MTRALRPVCWLICGGLVLVCAGRASAQGIGGGAGGGIGGMRPGGAGGGFGGATGATGGGITGGFTGGGMTGGGLTGGAGGLAGGAGAQGRVGTGLSLVPSASNPLRTYYSNPMYFGLQPPKTTITTSSTATTTTGGGFTGGTTSTPGATGTGVSVALPKSGGFGQPLFATVTTTTFGTTTTTPTTPAGFTTFGIRNNTPYGTAPGEDVPLVTYNLRAPELKLILDRSPRLNAQGKIIVEVQGPVVVLRGQVASERERRLAEAMLRLEPGVRDVDNQLRVGPK